MSYKKKYLKYKLKYLTGKNKILGGATREEAADDPLWKRAESYIKKREEEEAANVIQGAVREPNPRKKVAFDKEVVDMAERTGATVVKGTVPADEDTMGQQAERTGATVVKGTMPADEDAMGQHAETARNKEQILAYGSIGAVVLAAGVAVGCIILNK